ncbi:hypothetical protein K0U83_27430 [bacterium]|nr:hypothetical protein [bacterium]
MRVGLVSKPEHCRPHVKAIKDLGVKVEVLGGDPGLRIPRRIDALVVRTCSISHAAFDVARKWEREIGGKVFYIEGASAAQQAISEWVMKDRAKTLESVMGTMGWMHWHVIKSLPPEALVRLSIAEEVQEEIHSLRGYNPSTLRGMIKRSAEKMGWNTVSIMGAPGVGRPLTIYQDARRNGRALSKGYYLRFAEEVRNKDNSTPESSLETHAEPPMNRMDPSNTSPTPPTATLLPGETDVIPDDIRAGVGMLVQSMREFGFDSVQVMSNGKIEYERVIRVRSGFVVSDD